MLSHISKREREREREREKEREREREMQASGICLVHFQPAPFENIMLFLLDSKEFKGKS